MKYSVSGDLGLVKALKFHDQTQEISKQNVLMVHFG